MCFFFNENDMKSKSIAKKELELLNCAKKIRPPKLIKNDSKHSLWWENQFKLLENEREIPDYKKRQCLQTIYTDKEIEAIGNCGIKIVDDKKIRRNSGDFIELKKKNVNVARKTKSAPSLQTKYSNPFMEFMMKPKRDACTWYTKPESKLEELQIRDRAKKLRKNIVNKFVERFKAIAKSDEVNEHTVMSIFEMTCSFPISNTLHKVNEICGVVPETTARHLGCLEQSDQNKLLSQIIKDIKASEKPPSKIAFGKNLPQELRRAPFKEKPGDKWIEQNICHKSIETFAHVWQNITDLESTRRFCLYLLDHPNVTPPPFLVNEGLLIKKILKRPVYLGNLEKNYENQNTSDYLDISSLLQNINNTMADFNRKLNSAAANSGTSLSLGDISDIKIMV